MIADFICLHVVTEMGCLMRQFVIVEFVTRTYYKSDVNMAFRHQFHAVYSLIKSINPHCSVCPHTLFVKLASADMRYHK